MNWNVLVSKSDTSVSSSFTRNSCYRCWCGVSTETCRMTVTLILVQVLRHLQDKPNVECGGPPSLSDQRPPAWRQLPYQQSAALQSCCTGTPSALPASYHKVCVIFARCMHRKCVLCKGSSEITFWRSAFYVPACSAATARELLVSVLHVITLHKYPPPTEWYVKAGLCFYLYFLVSYNFSLAWTAIAINHQISKGFFWLVGFLLKITS